MIQKATLCIVILFTASVSFSQKNKRKAPPGTVKINDTLFVDKTEISNLNWREYLHYNEQFDPTSYQISLPDTTVWGKELVVFYDSIKNISIQSPDPITQYY